MPLDPVLHYGARVMAKASYRVSGDVRTGLTVTIPYLLPWENAFAFAEAIIAPIYATRVGTVSFPQPYQFRMSSGAVAYARKFDIEPLGVRKDGVVRYPPPNYGLGPGEFFDRAIVTVGFESLPFLMGAGDDAYGLNQLDPANPITLCEQSIDFGGRMVNRKGLQYVYDDTGKPVDSPVGVFLPETKLILHFPLVPYLPWQLLQPYVAKVNAFPVFQCPEGTLLLDAPKTQAKASINSPTPIQQSVTLGFTYNPDGWSTIARAGIPTAIHRKGSIAGVYDEADFREIFATLAFGTVPYTVLPGIGPVSLE